MSDIHIKRAMEYWTELNKDTLAEKDIPDLIRMIDSLFVFVSVRIGGNGHGNNSTPDSSKPTN